MLGPRSIEVRYPFGQVASFLLALAVTAIARYSGWSWALSEWDGWPVLSRVILVAAWVNVWAWWTNRWPVVIVCSLLTFVAPWGFIYPGIVAGPILAVAATLHWAKDGRMRRDLEA